MINRNEVCYIKDRIKTNRIRNIKRSKIIVFIIVSLAVLVMAMVLTRGALGVLQFAEGVRETQAYRELVNAATVFSIQMYFILFFPAAAIFFAIQTGRKKGIKENVSFNSAQGIMFYRDLLHGVSPSDISIISDLQIEKRKDISATLLRLYNKKVIAFKGQNIRILESSVLLEADETELLQILRQGGITNSAMAAWGARRINEAITKGYIKEGENKGFKIAKNCCFSGCLSVVLGVVSVFAFGIFILSDSGVAGRLDAYGEFVDQIAYSYMTVTEVLQFSQIIQELGLLVLILNIIAVIIPSFVLFRSLGYAMSKSMYERTQKGNELAEKIAGLQRYIHEFSMLNERQKEEVFLWDDFLVYAVVLEENEDIVKDISRGFGVDITGIEACVPME